jgi:hypothetical protein
MTVYTEADLRQNLERVLDEAQSQGGVRIRRGGQEFTLCPAAPLRSQLDVGGVVLNPPPTADEIVAAVRDGRDRDYSWIAPAASDAEEK